MMKNSSALRNIPKVDQVLACEELADYIGKTEREVVVNAVRSVIDEVRAEIVAGNKYSVTCNEVACMAAEKLNWSDAFSLRRVINATGIILHTNLGRALLSKKAAENAFNIACSYSTLEYNLSTGKRGSRHDHVSSLIAQVTGAEAAIAVNNNAAATLLCLAALFNKKEVIVSRGESVEIGGAFRIPEIMELSGAILKDVGTTNKTHLYDYERAVSKKTGAILKVHTSNYRVIGFHEDVSVKELAELAKAKKLPLVYDMGSGLMVDLRSYGLDEPCVSQAFEDGADLVLFSGDKLLGGPQAGIIAGKKKYIDKIKKHQMARPLRLDKITLAALESTFRAYRDKKQALKEIPILAMITQTAEELEDKAKRFKLQLGKIAAKITVLPATGRIGGGSAPMLDLKSYAVCVEPEKMSVATLERALIDWKMPIIARINEGKLLIDMRTVADEELRIIKEALTEILK